MIALRDEEEVQNFINQIDDMLSSGDYDWAEETLDGIQIWVSQNGVVTDKQLNAVDNIANNPKNDFEND